MTKQNKNKGALNMTIIEQIKKLADEDRMIEAFELAANNNIYCTEDWIEIDGKEFYQFTIEDDVYYYEI